MAVTTTNLGVITAYGDAVAAGYTGTKAEWQALMASYATVAEDANEAKDDAVAAKNAAVDAKNAAVQAKDTAVVAKDTATSKATEATTAANTATTKAGEASASAQSIAQSASQIAQNTSDISELKEDFANYIVPSTNLLNESTMINGYIDNNGVYHDDNEFRLSSYIPITLGVDYITNVGMTFIAYDSSKEFMRRGNTTAGAAGPFSDAGLTYIRLQTNKSGNLQLNQSSELLPYESYNAKLINTDLTDQIDPTLSIAGKAADAKAVKDKFARNLYPDWIIGELNSNGTVNTRNAGLRFSANVYLKAGTTITISASGYKFNAARYTDGSSSAMISGSYKSFSSGGVYTVPADSWVMCSIWHADNTPFSDTDESSVVIIAADTGFDEVYNVLAEIDEEITPLKINDSPLNKNAGIYYGIVPTDYYNGLQSDYTLDGFNRNTTYDSLVAKFDTLVDSVYVTKTDKGVSSDGVNHLYEYDFIPVTSTLTNKTKAQPKVLIVSGQHGFEKASIYGLFYFLKDLVENWEDNPILDHVRHHVVIKVIPCANPYGFNNNTYWNANGVNLNRNYATSGWTSSGEPYTSSYAGASAGSEIETQIISAFIQANTDAMIFMDFHTNGQYAVIDYTKINWLDFAPVTDAFFDYYKYFACAHVETITAHFNKDYNLGLTTQLCGEVTSGENGYSANFPSADVYALEHDVAGHTIEGFTGFPNGTDFSADALKGNSEIIGNWIKAVVYGTHLIN